MAAAPPSRLADGAAAFLAALLATALEALGRAGWEGPYLPELAAQRLPDLAVELVRLRADAIFCITSAAARAAKNATTTIPVVFVGVSDPVRMGWSPTAWRM